MGSLTVHRGKKEYKRLQQALTLEREAALKSTSYRRYQIMGFNHQSAGYDDVESFVRGDVFGRTPSGINKTIGDWFTLSRQNDPITATDETT
ncbi:N-acetylmuramidase domain-containing protein [Vibrio ruber]|uniref:N-acetylmuramidase domain-containing protein n=1 Tax=Vibrio ruber TaxID=184755 RepID=UPI001F2EFA05|nr:N-acetylmuramidase domain-containing protein [Vibrio ruber]